ncbi:MAG: sugar-binding domain-containing protein [Acidimicrobiales bacterium]
MRRQLDFDEGWTFRRGELATPLPRNGPKTGTLGGASDLTLAEGADPPMPASMRAAFGQDMGVRMFNVDADLDPDWEPVALPDDWTTRVDRIAPAVVTRGADMIDPAVSGGYLPAGVAWYRKVFEVPGEWAGRRVSIEFDGVMRDARIYINGSYIGSHYSGYTGFAFDLSEYLRYGDEGRNVVLVRTDTSSREGWWAEGAGIYRHVRLVVTGAVHVARHGVFVRTSRLDADAAVIRVDTEIDNDALAIIRDVAVAHTITTPGGLTIGATSAPTVLEAGRAVLTQEIELSRPALWSPNSPALHRLETVLRVGGVEVDRVSTTFGVRTFDYGADGLRVNGELTEIRGVCAHQDFAGVGVALPDRVHAHKIALLRELGCNAYRTGHHPPAPEILDACDRLGVLVLDENRRFETNDEGLADLAELIRRDRSRACVFMWALENEELVAQTAVGRRLLHRLVAVAAHLDPTRPSTIAGQFAKDDPDYMSIAPVAGFNYDKGSAARFRDRHPGHPVLATEDASFISTRGVYEDLPDLGLCSSHDIGSFVERMATAKDATMDAGTVGGATSHGRLTSTWEHLREHPYLGGAFLWTGFDYRGECVPFGWPAVNSSFGLMDMCGFPKDVAHYWRSRWSTDPVVHLLPHWNWEGREGVEITVAVYTNCDSIELVLNGRSLRTHEIDERGVLATTVAYEPGVLAARASRDGRVVAETQRATTGPPTAVVLAAADCTYRAGGRDVVVVRAAVVDAAGQIDPTADNRLVFATTDGAVLGTGNGSPADRAPACHRTRPAFNGLALAVVATPQAPGDFSIEASSPGLIGASITVHCSEPAAT